jgi:hypothetical protein
VRSIPIRAAAPVEQPMIQFVSLEKGKVSIRSFRKNILKLVGEELTPVMPDAKDSSASFRAIVTRFKRISDEWYDCKTRPCN